MSEIIEESLHFEPSLDSEPEMRNENSTRGGYRQYRGRRNYGRGGINNRNDSFRTRERERIFMENVEKEKRELRRLYEKIDGVAREIRRLVDTSTLRYY